MVPESTLFAHKFLLSFFAHAGEKSGDHQDCRVGGLPVNERATTGCLVPNGTVRVDQVANEVTYEYAADFSDNNNGRTLQGFSTDANARMRPGDNLSEDYFADFQKFVNYYGSATYADTIINSGFDATNTNLSNGNFQMSGVGYDGRLGKYCSYMVYQC